MSDSDYKKTTSGTSGKSAAPDSFGDLSITAMFNGQCVQGVRILVAGGSGTKAYVTDGGGVVFCKQLPAGPYSVSVAPGDPYKTDTQNVAVSAYQTATCTLQLVKQQFALKVQTYLDSPDPASTARQFIPGATVEAWQQGKLVDSKITPANFELDPGLTQFFVHASGGAIDQSYTSPFELVPLIFQVDGAIQELDIPLGLKLAQVQISGGIVTEQNGCQTVNPFANFTVRLFNGAQRDGVPIRQIESAGHPIVVLSDLERGLYTFVVSPSSSYTGAKLAPAQVLGDTVTMSVYDGQVIEVPNVLFRVSEGRVSARSVTEDGKGLPGISFALTPADPKIPPSYGKSDKDGYAPFGAVLPGPYTVSLVQEVSRSCGKDYVSASAVDPSQAVTIVNGAKEQVLTFVMKEDVHEIFGTVKADGAPVPHAVIHISDEFGKEVTTTADSSGSYKWIAPRAGSFELWLDDPPRQVYRATVNSPAEVNLETSSAVTRMAKSQFGFNGGGSGGGTGGGQNGEARESFIDLQAYPILTENIGSSSMPATGTTQSGGGSGYLNLGQTVTNALKDVLSWKPKANDPKSFMTALTQSFDLSDLEGHTEYTWKPKSYTVQTDLGEVTGAQASIYTRAKVALDQLMPLLNGLYASTNEVPQEDLDSMRVVISTAAKSIVDEFGREGGPRVPRVDQLFTLLLGHTLPVSDPEQVGGELKRLRRRFGLERRFVNTIEDEQNLTNFLILVDYLSGLQTSWDAQKPFFTRNGLTKSGKEPFFGTQLVLLSRAVEVITQSVQDVYFAMDSVFLGAAERGTIELDYAGQTLSLPDGTTFLFGDNESSLFADELLEWSLQVSQEGLQYLKDGGKDGIHPFRTTMDRVRKFVRGALLAPIGVQTSSSVPPGYKTPRVQRALLDLANQLDEAHRLAIGIKSPRIEEEIATPSINKMR